MPRLILPAALLFAVPLLAMPPTMTTAWAQPKPVAHPAPAAAAPGPATSAGPGRIVCATAKTCDLGIGNPAKLFYKINIESLPAEDRDRLIKSCKPKGAAPCIVTIAGNEMGDPIRLKATTIKWHN